MGIVHSADVWILSCSQQKEVSLGDLNVIPAPYEVVEQNERAAFVIDNSTKIVYPEGNEKMKRNAEFLASYIRNLTGVEVGLSVGGDTGAIVLALDDAVEGEEGYELNVSSERILLKGKTEAGVFTAYRHCIRQCRLQVGKRWLPFRAAR